MITNSNLNATERDFNLRTFLRYLYSSYSTYLHLHFLSHFRHLLTFPRFTHLDDLLDLWGF